MFGSNKKQDYEDNKFSIISFSNDKGKFKRISSKEESICILPFDTNDRGQIRNVYLFKYRDYLSDSDETRCITETLDPNSTDSYYEAVCSCLNREAGITELDVNQVFYLGKIKHTIPFTKSYRCYGVNISDKLDQAGNLAKLPGVEPANHFHSVEKIKFTRLLKGEVCDSLALACSTLLLSYLSE